MDHKAESSTVANCKVVGHKAESSTVANCKVVGHKAESSTVANCKLDHKAVGGPYGRETFTA